MDWQKLDQNEAKQVLSLIQGSDQARLFTGDMIEVKLKSLPFYSNFMLYRITNYATMPMFSLDYLGHGDTLYYLDGSADPIYTVNHRAPLRLTPDCIPDYINFFFEHVTGRQGDVLMIEDPRRGPMVRSLDKSQIQAIVDKFQPLRVEYESGADTYTATTTLYYDGSLISAVLSITATGHIYLQEERLLLQGFPVQLNRMYA